jgi:polyisoprenoid-binding protein YceI
MKKKLLSIIVILLFPNIAVNAYAKKFYYKFNNKSSNISYYITSTFHKPEGRASKFRGYINIEVNENNKILYSDGILEIFVSEMTSEDFDPISNDTDRDNKMKEEILYYKKYPIIKFKVNEVKITKDNLKENKLEANLIGKLFIAGKENNVSVPVKIRLSPDKEIALVEGEYDVSIKEFNLPDPSLGPIKVEDLVKVKFNLKTY